MLYIRLINISKFWFRLWSCSHSGQQTGTTFSIILTTKNLRLSDNRNNSIIIIVVGILIRLWQTAYKCHIFCVSALRYRSSSILLPLYMYALCIFRLSKTLKNSNVSIKCRYFLFRPNDFNTNNCVIRKLSHVVLIILLLCTRTL